MDRVFVLPVTFIAWIALNYYIGWHGIKAFGAFLNGDPVLYWAVLFLLAVSYVLGKTWERIYPGRLSRMMTVIGSYWLAFFFYAFLTLIFIDLLYMLNNWLGFLPVFAKEACFHAGTAVVLFLVLLIAYGTINARNPVINRYNITIAKSAGNIKDLHIIMVSDLHLGSVVNEKRLSSLVRTINEIRPDLVFLVGDIIDENVRVFKKLGMTEILKGLNPEIGSYAVLGNHDYYGGQYRYAIKLLEDAGVKVLRDEWVFIGESFYLVGRDDKFSRFRKKLEILLENVDTRFPVIVLDHNPADMEEAEAAGVDLQLSGHTHRGQLAPLHRITRRIFLTDWGYLRRGDFQAVVSNGFGTWGPPIRIGNRPEIVEIFLHFGDA